MDLLKLAALDEDDLSVVSAHLQDALMLVGDIRYLRAETRFIMIANRFDWDGAAGKSKRSGMRRRSGLHFNRVLSVQSQKIKQGADEAVLSLLAIEFTAGDDPPAGTITLTFSGGGAIRLAVECIEASLEDLGPMWETAKIPDHGD